MVTRAGFVLFATPLKRIPPACFHRSKIAAAFAAAAAIFAGASATAAHAIIVFRGNGRNLSPPTGPLSVSGWQYEGLWNGFTGTVIGPHQFITATHVGGQVGALFDLDGEKYAAVGWTHIPNSDMTIWWVDGTFPRYAPLYEKSDEVGRPLMLLGRGTSRGAAIRINGQLRGWRWGENDAKLSWGKNKAEAITQFNESGPDFDGGGDWLGGGSAGKANRSLGEMLVWGFVQNGDLDTGSVSSGDSGGAAFIKDGKTWKLAGIIHGTDPGFRRQLPPHPGSEPFRASVFEAKGLFRAMNNSLIGASGSSSDDRNLLNRCSLGFACRISSHKAEIDDALTHPPRSRFTKRFLGAVAGGTLVAAGLLGGGITALVKRRAGRRENQRRK